MRPPAGRTLSHNPPSGAHRQRQTAGWTRPSAPPMWHFWGSQDTKVTLKCFSNKAADTQGLLLWTLGPPLRGRLRAQRLGSGQHVPTLATSLPTQVLPSEGATCPSIRWPAAAVEDQAMLMKEDVTVKLFPNDAMMQSVALIGAGSSLTRCKHQFYNTVANYSL